MGAPDAGCNLLLLQTIFGTPGLKQYCLIWRVVMPGSRRPAVTSDDWMHEQQLRAELEAEAWRRLRLELAPAQTAEIAPTAPDYHSSGSAILKGLVRFGLGACGGYLGWLAAVDSGLGEFEAWLAVGGGFILVLALSLVGPFRRMVHLLAETARWLLVSGLALGALWVLLQGPP